MTSTIEQLALMSLERFNEGDLDGVRQLMGPGFVYEETGTGRRLDDIDEVIAVFRAWRTALPDVRGTLERMIIDGGTVAMEFVWRGTHTGTLVTPTGDLPPTGRPVQVRATMWQEWRDGRLVSERHHLDVLSLLAQVGAIPVPA
jgi:steroid delta-isomerase-like uncharacterized protein